MKDLIRKYALQNAVQHDGRASQGAVLGKILAEKPSFKNQLEAVSKEVREVVEDVNGLSLEQQIKELARVAPELLQKKKGAKHELPELPHASAGKVVTRLPPEPSKYSHLGHALSFLINYFYAEKYKGRCILRFEDTNPASARQEYVDSIIKDIEFLGIKPSSTTFVSDDMDKFYEAATQLIEEGRAYACLCDRERLQEFRQKAAACEHREKPVSTNYGLWQDMLSGKLEEGTAVLRLKLDMAALNHALRDPAIFRIIDVPHYRQKKKFKVWPLYDFANALEDSWCGVTHILRSAEFGTMRIELQEKIKELFSLPKQYVVQYGRFSIDGAITKGREIRAMIEDGKVLGWDDPRLITVMALKRRGIQPDAFRQLAVQVGLSKTETNLDWDVLAALNRKIVEPEAKRYFFIEDPVRIVIEGAERKTAGVPYHPDRPELGERVFHVHDSFFISKRDFKSIKSGKLVRLMDCLNFRKEKNRFVFVSNSVEDFRHTGGAIIQWLPDDKKEVPCDIVMPDASLSRGLAEHNIREVKEGDVVQFVRFGFCRLDSRKGATHTFWYTHD